MKRRVGLILFITFILFQSISAMDYGLHFNSHATPGEQRTSLTLNSHKDFKLENELSITFMLQLRKEPAFGTIFQVQTNDGQFINVAFSIQNGNISYPSLIINEDIKRLDVLDNKLQNTSVKFTLLKKENLAQLTVAGKTISSTIPLQNTNKLKFIFGEQITKTDHPNVAPINVCDIRIFENQKNTFHWELKHHNDSVCYDLIQQAPAVACHPHWILDDHVQWKEVYADKTKKKIQVAFNAANNLFYITDDQQITVLSPTTKEKRSIPIKNGHRAMMYSNHLEYDTITHSLLSYSLKEGFTSRFNFQTGNWSLSTANLSEPTYSNHSWSANGSEAYTFGGYGFYHFQNQLFKIDLKTDKITACPYQPEISPRCSAASALVGDELYIFGGLGNRSGKQELPSQYYYDLHAINLKTMKSRKIWEAKKGENDFIPASTMIFNPEDSSFYATTTEYGGMIIKLSIKEPHWEYISGPVWRHLKFKDFVFNMYHAPKYNKIYLVIDKRMNDLSHELSILSIDCPLQENNQITQSIAEPWYEGKTSLWLLLLCCPLVLAGYMVIKKRSKEKNKETERKREQDFPPEKNEFQALPAIEMPPSFDRSRSCISLLGGFCVRDKNGQDITSSFTPRTKSLLIILLLYSEKQKQGIHFNKLDESIWGDKDEESARNNRNAYMSRLRILLKEVGNIEITNDKTHFCIHLGKDVFFDYHTALAYINLLEQNGETNKEIIYPTLELLLYGELLPNTTYEWLDDFKGSYSSASITLLISLLLHEMEEGNDALAMKITDTIFLHDSLNEEALAAKCKILCNRKMKGIAKNVYDKFCKEYQDSLGEKYTIPFNELGK